jgi:hypothetical protein
MQRSRDNDEVTLERLERALCVVALIVVEHGDAFAPILERLEREVEAARRDSARERARRILEAYTDAGGRKAMRSSQPSLASSE